MEEEQYGSVAAGLSCVAHAGSVCEAGERSAECALGHQWHCVPLDVLPAADGQQPGFTGERPSVSAQKIVFVLFGCHCVCLTKIDGINIMGSNCRGL